MKIEITVMDREYAQLMALESAGICTPRELLTDALLKQMREVSNPTKNREILTSKVRKKFEKELSEQMKSLPPYWYTEEQAEEWHKNQKDCNKK